LVECATRSGTRLDKNDLRHVVRTLQMTDESAQLDGAMVSPRRVATLPPLFAQFVHTRTDRSQKLNATMHHRRALKKLPTPSRVTMSFQQLEDEFSSMEWSDGVGGSSHDLRSFCTEMELDVSQVSLDEVRVLRAHSHRRPLPSAKQAVQVLKLLQYDCAGTITKDMLLSELERLDQGGRRSSAQQKAQTVRMVLDLEEELGAPELVHQRTVSRLPPPLPSGVSPHPSASPEPPPFPKHLLAKTSSDESDSGRLLALSPPVPAYPYGSVPPISTSHHVRFHSLENELSPEKQYEGLVEHIIELGLTKSP
jgi:hypothetical protein